MQELTIREILINECDWPRRFLSPSGEVARLDFRKLRDQEFGFKPFGRWQRWKHRSALLPLERVFPLGCCSIRFDERLADNKEFFGAVEPVADASFPFDEWLETCGALDPHEKRFGFLASLGRRTWWCHFVVLTFLHDVKIRTTAFD